MASMFNKLIGKVRRITGKMDQYQEAITFAEAGQPINAQSMAPEKESRHAVFEEEGKRYIVNQEIAG